MLARVFGNIDDMLNLSTFHSIKFVTYSRNGINETIGCQWYVDLLFHTACKSQVRVPVSTTSLRKFFVVEKDGIPRKLA